MPTDRDSIPPMDYYVTATEPAFNRAGQNSKVVLGFSDLVKARQFKSTMESMTDYKNVRVRESGRPYFQNAHEVKYFEPRELTKVTRRMN